MQSHEETKEKNQNTHFPVKIIAFNEFPFPRLPAISLLGRIHLFPINNRNGMAMNFQERGAGPVLCAIIPHPIQQREIIFEVPGERN